MASVAELKTMIATETNAIQSILTVYLGVADDESKSRIFNYVEEFLSDLGVSVREYTKVPDDEEEEE